MEATAATVRYDWPGGFRTGGWPVRIGMEGPRLGLVLARLGAVLPFPEYDRLSWAVWVVPMKAEAQAETARTGSGRSPTPES